jgi:hypothetical protein
MSHNDTWGVGSGSKIVLFEWPSQEIKCFYKIVLTRRVLDRFNNSSDVMMLALFSSLFIRLFADFLVGFLPTFLVAITQFFEDILYKFLTTMFLN